MFFIEQITFVSVRSLSHDSGQVLGSGVILADARIRLMPTGHAAVV